MNSIQLRSTSELPSKCGDSRWSATIIADQNIPRDPILSYVWRCSEPSSKHQSISWVLVKVQPANSTQIGASSHHAELLKPCPALQPAMNWQSATWDLLGTWLWPQPARELWSAAWGLIGTHRATQSAKECQNAVPSLIKIHLVNSTHLWSLRISIGLHQAPPHDPNQPGSVRVHHRTW